MAILKKSAFLVLLAWSMVIAEYAGADFLKLQYGIQEMGQSGAGTGASGSPGFMCLNPAALSSAMQRFLHINRTIHREDTKQYFMQAAYHFAKFSVGVGAFYRDGDAGHPADEEGRVDTTITIGDGSFVPAVSLAKRINRVGMGLTAKMFQWQLAEYSSLGGAVDFGLQYHLLQDKAMLGLAVLNVGKARSFVSEKYEIPLLIRLGASGEAQFNNFGLTLNADAVYSLHETRYYFPTSAELNWKNTAFLRIGYPALRTPSPWGLGAGFRYKIFQIDYTYEVAVDDLSSSNGVGLTVWKY